MNYKLVIAYDGTDYTGWQVQPQGTAVANVLQKTFVQCFNKPIRIIGASRTDAGVHALGQVATFETDLNVHPDKIMWVWNNKLPRSLSIRSLQIVDDRFHPQADVKQKTYYYHFFTERPLPFIARYGYFYNYPLDIAKVQDALRVFEGTHDFRSFCTGDDMSSTIRTIDAISLDYIKRYNVYRISVRGK